MENNRDDGSCFITINRGKKKKIMKNVFFLLHALLNEKFEIAFVAKFLNALRPTIRETILFYGDRFSIFYGERTLENSNVLCCMFQNASYHFNWKNRLNNSSFYRWNCRWHFDFGIKKLGGPRIHTIGIAIPRLYYFKKSVKRFFRTPFIISSVVKHIIFFFVL